MDEPLISSAIGILTTVCAVPAFFFWLEDRTKAKLFNYFPPLIFIYALPALMSNTGVMTNTSPVYGWMGSTVMPMFLVMMLLKVDIASTIRMMGRGVFVMLFGTAGVVLGAPIAFDRISDLAREELASVGMGPDVLQAPADTMSEQDLIERADEVIPGLPDAVCVEAGELVERVDVA